MKVTPATVPAIPVPLPAGVVPSSLVPVHPLAPTPSPSTPTPTERTRTT